MSKRNIEEELATASAEYVGLSKANSASRVFPGNGIHNVRSEYARTDFEYYRPGQSVPKTVKEEVDFCMKAYSKVALIRNVVDLMSDFGVQGIKWSHTNKATERFINSWFEYVSGYNISERFLNLLYRTANVPIYRQEGKIPIPSIKEWKSKASISPQNNIFTKDFVETKISKRNIPVKYTLLNPLTIDVVGGGFSTFTGDYQYVLKLPDLINMNDSTIFPINFDNAIKQLPDDIQKAYNSKQSYIPLDKDKFSVFFYKKDDWLVWAQPMLSSLMNSLIILEKMHLADISALDGAISSVRLWKLGIYDTANPQNSIIPTKAVFNKLRNMLQNNIGGGQMDLVWGPDIELKETSTEVHKFLGDSKYKQVMSELYSGLGIPASLTGEGSSSGMTNNFVSMKTLIDRLIYGRQVLTSFWMKEMKRLKSAIGFAGMPELNFDHMTMTDESAYLTLLINLADRNIISDEAIRERVKFSEEIEKSRIARENKMRKDVKIPPKAGPYHNPEYENDMKKIVLQSGAFHPSQVGLDIPDAENGKEPIAKILHSAKPKPAPINGVDNKFEAKPLGGRPKSKKDSVKRKSRVPKPRSSAMISHTLWATKAQNIINEILLPGITHIFGKSNLRQLTTADKESYEKLKYRVLRNIEAFTEVTPDMVLAIMHENKDINSDMVYISDELISQFMQNCGKSPTTDELRQIQASAHALYYENNENI